MIRSIFLNRPLIAVLLLALTGCATPLPSTYEVSGTGPIIDGPILALAGEKDTVVAVNSNGLFIKKGDGPWVEQEAPGIRKWKQVTSLIVDKGVIYLGSDGEGLHILSDGVWEVKTGRYGGLPDDGVLSIAIDKEGVGLPGVTLWVGTRDGVAARRDGQWKIYRPGDDWLTVMNGKSGAGAGKVYLGSGFRLGRRGEDSKLFRPPVAAIGIGPDGLAFGNTDSRIAVVRPDAVSILLIRDDFEFTRLLFLENSIWAGTDKGLIWGGLQGYAKGKPWPTNRGYLGWSGSLFGSRNSMPFEYRWKLFGYNDARIVDLTKRESDIWVAYRSDSDLRTNQGSTKSNFAGIGSRNQLSAFRLYISIDEYIARKEIPQYETYGLNAGIKGKPTAMYVPPDSGTLWVGTDKGLWELKQ